MIDPKYLNREELIRIAKGLILDRISQPWIDALVSELVTQMDANEELEREMARAEEASIEAERQLEDAFAQANEWEDKYISTLVEIDTLREIVNAINLDKDGSGFVCEEMMDNVREVQSKTL